MGAADDALEFRADRAEEVTDDEYVAVTRETFVGPAIERFREFEPVSDETTVYYLYVTDNAGRLVGVMSLRELLNASEDDVVEEHMVTDLVTIDADTDPEYAATETADLDFPALPVVDDDGFLVGVLRTDDVIEVVEEGATEDIMKSAGFSFADVESSRSSAILESLEETLPTEVTVETALDAGKPARVIVRYADDHDVDGIVLGSHGREGPIRYLLGSVTEDVVRRAGVPVTVVRGLDD